MTGPVTSILSPLRGKRTNSFSVSPPAVQTSATNQSTMIGGIEKSSHDGVWFPSVAGWFHR